MVSDSNILFTPTATLSEFDYECGLSYNSDIENKTSGNDSKTLHSSMRKIISQTDIRANHLYNVQKKFRTSFDFLKTPFTKKYNDDSASPYSATVLKFQDMVYDVPKKGQDTHCIDVQLKVDHSILKTESTPKSWDHTHARSESRSLLRQGTEDSKTEWMRLQPVNKKNVAKKPQTNDNIYEFAVISGD